MRRWLDPQRLAPAAAVLLAVLLGVLAVLQYRWIAEVSQAERQRMRAGLQAAAERLAAEVDREVGRVVHTFEPAPRRGGEAAGDPSDRLLRQLRSWRATAPHPELVRDLFVVRPREGAGPALERLDETAGRLAPAPWPAELARVRERLREERPAPRRRWSPRAWGIEAEAPAVVLPLAWPERGRRDDDGRGVLIVRLDREHLTRTLLPELVAVWFGGPAGEDVLVAVTESGRPLYLSDPSLPAARYLPGEVSAPLLAARWPHHRPPPGRFAAPPLHGEARGEGPWRVVVTHRAGSLEAAVARARRRNLALSGAVLLLLAGSLAVMAFAAQRARRLARQQMELVAGVTHDLNTPLAAIRSAAQNLADGVVAAPEQVRRYGTLIEREGSRLSALVAEALELAGIQSGSRVYRPEPVALAEVVGEALDASRWALQEGGFAVEEDVPADLPPVRADRGALRLAVQNLVDNAVKHAAAGRWLGLRARAAGPWVTLTVEDRGPGIRPEDRPHLFEPFFRGPAAAGPVPGSGLGLSLVRQVVEAQGGRVSVAPGAAGRGSAFALRLPVHA
jgi:two-component system, OmpR family, sensor histidine kinase SenX3